MQASDLGALTRLHIDESDGIVVVRLDTKHKANAFCLETMQELTQVALALAESSDVRAVILTGQGEAFSGGMDLSDPLVSNPSSCTLSELRRGSMLGAKMCQAWESIPVITVAAIEGYCVGAGVALSLALDFRVCSATSLLYVPEIERGMNMSWQSVPRSVNLIGPAKTKRMFILAEKVSAEMASEWGWADYTCESGYALVHAQKIANRVAELPPLSVRMCKQSVNAAANALNNAVSYMDADQFVLAQHSDDYAEGINAFIEKRAPKYTGN